MKSSPKLASISSRCVACGCCVPVCPRAALHVHGGMAARVDETLCIGCGKCVKACPAAIIRLVAREALT